MPQPHEEMKSLHNELRINDRQKLYTTEARERWLESNRGSTDYEYKRFAATGEFIPWRDELISSLETSRIRSKAEERFTSDLTSVDHHTLIIRHG
jgi:hypothetical protein